MPGPGTTPERTVTEPTLFPTEIPQPLAFTLNHVPVVLHAKPGARLLDVLRESGHLTGTKEGCGEGECGACTILLEGKPVCSCLLLAQTVEGQDVVTIEGLAASLGARVHPLQAAFMKHMGTQCGFCAPGMLMSAAALLQDNPQPTEAEVKEALSGNLCRCTGYTRIIRAVQEAGAQLRARSDEVTEALSSEAVARALSEGDS
jgi:carbon-monoxide dehydrogenase small subunit